MSKNRFLNVWMVIFAFVLPRFCGGMEEAGTRESVGAAKHVAAKKIATWWKDKRSLRTSIKNVGLIDCDAQGYPTSMALKDIMVDYFFQLKTSRGKLHKTLLSKEAKLMYLEKVKSNLEEKIMIETITMKERGKRTDKMFVVCFQDDQMRRLFFLKISSKRSGVGDVEIDPAENLRKVQESRIGRLGFDARSNKALPIIVSLERFFVYRDKRNQERCIEMTHAAPGDLVQNIFDGCDLELQKRCGERLGKALGSFHNYFMRYEDQDDVTKWYTIFHGDFHMKNVVFNRSSSRVYFIDNETMAVSLDARISLISGGDVPKFISLIEAGIRESVAKIVTCDETEDDVGFQSAVKQCNARIQFLLSFMREYIWSYPSDKRSIITDYLKKYLRVSIHDRLLHFINFKIGEASEHENVKLTSSLRPLKKLLEEGLRAVGILTVI